MSTNSATRRAVEAGSPDYITLGAFALSTLVGGANAVAVRFSNAELPPFWGATLRFTGAALILWIIALSQRNPLPKGRSLVGVVLYGVLNFGASYALLYWGLQTVQAGMTQVILALVPLLTLLFAIAHGQETFRWRGLVGAVLALSGIGLAFFQQSGDGAPLVAIVAVMAGAACLAEGAVIIKGFPASPPMITNAVAMSVGAGMLVALSLLAGEAWRLPSLPQTWIAVLYLIVFGSVLLFTLVLFVIRRWTASATAYQLVLMPFVTITLASLLAGERITIGFVLGGALVLIGVWIGALARFPRRAAGDEPERVSVEP